MLALFGGQVKGLHGRWLRARKDGEATAGFAKNKWKRGCNSILSPVK
jgi:hypothetical protein